MSEKIVEIETFSQDIYKFVCRLTRQLSPNRNGPTEESFCNILDSESVHLLVLYDDNETPVAMLTIGVYRTPTGYKAWIEDVVVDNAYRGQGYGRKLVAGAIDFCKTIGVDAISLTSNPLRTVANQLYQVLGFSLYETNVYKMELEKTV